KHVDQDVDAAPILQDGLSQPTRAFRRRQVGSDVGDPLRRLRWHGARGCRHASAGFREGLHDCSAKAQRAAGYHGPQAIQVKVEAHPVTSRLAIRPHSRRKDNLRSIGLPGKVPAVWLWTTWAP